MLEECAKDLIATKAKIDRERIRIVAPTAEEPYFVVGIQACTEGEYRRIQKGLNVIAEQGIQYRVVRDEDGAKSPSYDLEKMKEMMGFFGTAPDGQLDGMFAERCSSIPDDISLPEMLTFIRNMRDQCVFCAGASGFVLQIMSDMLEDYPEPEGEMDARRAVLPQ